MVMLPKRNLIEDAIENGLILQEKRSYMGCSSLGGKCHRKIWLNFRWVYDAYIGKRTARIFERGELEEPRVIKDLRSVGIKIHSQQASFSDETGHIKGHIDGMASNVIGAEQTYHLLEVKTMNGKRFSKYKKLGLEKSDFTYWVQIHLYMGFAKLKRTLFIVTNKDTEERAYDRYRFDETVFKESVSKGHGILMTEYPPEKIGNKMYYDCKMCSAYNYCHGDVATNRNCRTCQFSELEMEGKWKCNFHNMGIDENRQNVGCPNYFKIEGLK